MVPDFCLLKPEIARFAIGFCLKVMNKCSFSTIMFGKSSLLEKEGIGLLSGWASSSSTSAFAISYNKTYERLQTSSTNANRFAFYIGRHPLIHIAPFDLRT